MSGTSQVTSDESAPPLSHTHMWRGAAHFPFFHTVSEPHLSPILLPLQPTHPPPSFASPHLERLPPQGVSQDDGDEVGDVETDDDNGGDSGERLAGHEGQAT